MIIGISGPDFNLISSIFNKAKQLYKDSLLYVEKPSEKLTSDIEAPYIINLTKHFNNLFIEYKKLDKIGILHNTTLVDSIAYSRYFALKVRNNKEINVEVSTLISDDFENKFLNNYNVIFYCQPQTCEKDLLQEYNNVFDKIKSKVIILSGSENDQINSFVKEMKKNNILEKKLINKKIEV
jgi:hypothetical protein